jgi:hypothetical protein
MQSLENSPTGWHVGESDEVVQRNQKLVVGEDQPGKTTRLTARSRDTLWRSVLISPFRGVCMQTEL